MSYNIGEELMEKKLEINIENALIKFKPFDASRSVIVATYQEKNLDTYGKYTIEEVPYTEFINSFGDIINYNEYYEDERKGTDEWLRDIEILKPCPSVKIDYGIDNIICELEHYLDSDNSLGFKSMGEHYGYSIYKYLEEYTRYRKWEEEILDIHGYCVIRDRMQYMLEQCKQINCYIAKTNELKKVKIYFAELERQAMIMLNLCLKFYFTRNIKLLDEIVIYLKAIKEKDYESTRQYISILRKNNN